MDLLDARVKALEETMRRLVRTQSPTKALMPDPDTPEMTPEREAAIQSLSSGVAATVTNLKYINPHCIVGKTACRNRYGVKVTRREMTFAKYKCPPDANMTVVLDADTRKILFP